MFFKNIFLWNSTLDVNFWIIILKLLQVPSVMESHHDNHHTLLYFYSEGITILLWLRFLILGLICEIPVDINHLIHGLYWEAFIRTESCAPARTSLVAWEQRYKMRDVRVVCDLSHTERFLLKANFETLNALWKKTRRLGLQHVRIFKIFDYSVCKHPQINSEI